MFYERMAIQHRGDSPKATLPLGSDLRLGTTTDHRARYAAERALDQVLVDSFPASDPPSWTLGVASPASLGYTQSVESTDETAADSDREPATVGVKVIALSPPRPRRTFAQALASFAGATGIVLLVPFAILLVGLPIVLVVRGVAEAIAWLLARIAG